MEGDSKFTKAEIEQELMRLWINQYLYNYLWTLFFDFGCIEFKYDLEVS